MLLICASEVQKQRNINKNLVARETRKLTAHSEGHCTMEKENKHLPSTANSSGISKPNKANKSKRRTHGPQNGFDPNIREQRKVKTNRKKPSQSARDDISDRTAVAGRKGKCILRFPVEISQMESQLSYANINIFGF